MKAMQTKTAAALLLFVWGAGIFGCSRAQRGESSPPETINDVPVTVVQRAKTPEWIEAVGTVQAARISQIASQVTGNIRGIRAREGDRVQRGQVLALLEDAQERAAVDRAAAAVIAAKKQVAVADSELALAESTMNRYQQLYDKKSVSPQEFDQVKARYQSAQAQRDAAHAGEMEANAGLAEARTSLGYTRIRAPFSGLVTGKAMDIGTLASPGMPVFTLEDTSNYRLEATVNESDIGAIHTGEAADVRLDGPGITFSGKVAQIVPAADPASHSFLVKIALPADSRLRSGLFGRARFLRGMRETILIPRSAVVEQGQLEGVFVVASNGIAELRYIMLGEEMGQQAEVLSGLQAGEQVIAAPGDRQFGGKRIGVRP